MGFGIATQTGVSAAIQSIPSFMSNSGLRNGYGATFSENFTDGTNTLDPRITFSRASNATVTNSAGLIQYAPHNLLLYSEQFDNSAWVKTAATITANTTVSPDGTTTADKLVETATTSNHGFTQSVTIASGTTYSFSFYAKAAERTQAIVTGFGMAGAGFLPVFTLTGNGTVTAAPTGSSITLVGNGWYRCVVVFTATNTTSPSILLGVSGNSSYLGDGTSGAFIWGAQLNVGSLQPYNPTTVKNLLGFSEAFDNAAWTKARTSISATKVTAPNGTVTGQKLVEDTNTNTHVCYYTSFTFTAGIYTASFYLKAAERTRAEILCGSATTPVALGFDLSNGTTFTATFPGTVAPTSSSMISVGNGWYRCSITWTTIAGVAIDPRVYLNNGTTTNYTGNGTSGIFMWGAQLSDSASLDTYVNNPVAAPTAAAYYGPRFDYDPVTLQPKGLLIEEQRTNLALRSEEFNSATWGATNFTVLSDNIVSPDGTQDAEALIETTTASAFHYAQQTITKAASAIQYTASIYVKAKGRQIGMSIATGAGGAVGRFNPDTGVITLAASAYGTWTAQSFTATAVGNGWYRCVLTGTSDTATSFAFQISTWNTALNTNVYTGDGVSGFYVWGAQVEAGAFATSYIPTVASQVTRSADIALIQGSNFSGWYNQNEGTIFCNATDIGYTLNGMTYAMSDGGSSNLIQLFRNAEATKRFSIDTAAVNQVTLSSNTTTGIPFVSAFAYQTNNVAACVNAGAVQTDTSAALPFVDRLYIGSRNGSLIQSQTVKQIAYYPTRLQNSQLQAITQ